MRARQPPYGGLPALFVPHGNEDDAGSPEARRPRRLHDAKQLAVTSFIVLLMNIDVLMDNV